MSGIFSFLLATFILLLIGQIFSFRDSIHLKKICWVVYFLTTSFVSYFISKNALHSTISEYVNYMVVGLIIGAFSCAVNSLVVVSFDKMGLDRITMVAYLAGGAAGGELNSLVRYIKRKKGKDVEGVY